MLVTRYDRICWWRSWAVSKNGTVLDESFVCERTVGNEDRWAKAYVNGDDGSVLDMEIVDYVFEFS